MLSRSLVLALLGACFVLACNEDTLPDGGGGEADAGPGNLDANLDATVPDLSFRDGGIRDSGVVTDELFQGEADIRGLRTWVNVHGTTTSTLPTVLILSRGPEHSHEYLLGPMSFLHTGRLVIYYDMRATGRSSFGMVGTATLTPDVQIADIDGMVEYAQTFRASPKVDMVGHGYGGSIALVYSTLHPDKVGRVVITNPYPATALQLARLNGETESRLTTTERTIVNRVESSPECRGDANMCGLVLWGYYGPHLMCEPNRPLFRQLDFQYVSYLTKDFIDRQLREAQYDWGASTFPQVSVPTTLISGPCDATPAEVIDTYVTTVPGLVHYPLLESGDFPMVEQADDYRNLVMHALAR